MPSAGVFEKICDSCRNKLTHATCSVCRKYRKVSHRSEDNSPQCVDCAQNTSVSHPCPGCGTDVPGKGLSKCRGCLNKVAIEREVTLSSALFVHAWVATLWARFAAWMHERRPANPKTLSALRSHQVFFERIDAVFTSPLELDGRSILQLYGTAELRKHMLPVQFLAEQLDVHVPSQAKSAASEEDRIREVLIAAKRQPWNTLLHGYYQNLAASALAGRSVRMYVSSAALFCGYANVGSEAWQAGLLERYLHDKPGARNNLHRFVTFCRDFQGWDVRMPTKGALVRPLIDPVRSAQKLRGLIKKIEEAGIENSSRSDLGAVIAVSLGLRTESILSQTAQLDVSSDGVVFVHGRERIHIPDELAEYARRLAEMSA